MSAVINPTKSILLRNWKLVWVKPVCGRAGATTKTTTPTIIPTTIMHTIVSPHMNMHLLLPHISSNLLARNRFLSGSLIVT